ncbi:MAG: hypothetical protein JAY90_06555 [Candidatus Thiodiazotropha lotti]|nr:hypothetical protein [Candidatus Thiodiazotropha lotti]
MSYRLAAIHIKPGPSRQLMIWHRSLSAMTFLAIITAPIDVALKALLLLILFLLTRLPVSRKFSPEHVARAEIKSNGWSKIVLADGEKYSARLRTDSLVTPWLILLRFNLRGRWRHPVMVLFQDALPAEEMRNLRILLKHGSFTREEPIV